MIKLDEFQKQINNANSIAIFGHENIDWDCVGACLGLAKILEKLRKKIYLYTPKKPLPIFDFVPWIQKFNSDINFDINYDLIIICDTADPINLLSKYRENNKKFFDTHTIINIDHHVSNTQYGDINIIKDDISSASEIILMIIQQIWWNLIDPDIAQTLLLGIITDTMNFTTTNTTPKTLYNAQILMKNWANMQQIIQNFWMNMEYNAIKFWEILISRLEIQEKIAYTYFTDDELKKHQINREEAASFLEIMKKIKQADIFILFSKDENTFRINVRSHRPISKDIASKLGWWWHPNAAGAKFIMKNDFKKTVEQTLQQIINIKNSLNSC